MILYPAIDVRGGGAVRLLKGSYEQETPYDPDPADAARRWRRGGADYLHVVDLDGARSGRPENLDAIAGIAAAAGCPIEVGGGLRERESVRRVLAAGAERVVIGTAAMRDPGFLEVVLSEHGAERVVVAVDARGGEVSVSGWTEGSGIDAAEAVKRLEAGGVERFLFTPIDVDGTMEGPDLAELTRVAGATGAAVIASGGVGELSHLELLAAEAPDNVEGVIVGRALYEERFGVAEAIEALRAGGG